ncbi:MAG: DUF547 domain-containing protein [Fibrobacteria bacterium]|nr:DUF547 domain-containing protein [Fibrobacteria bacterium]
MIKQICISGLLVFLASSLNYGSMHDSWDGLLQKYVANGLVDYEGLKANADDLQVLETYLSQLEKSTLTNWSRDQKLAFWINAYNAFTIKLILNNYPLKSIRDIKKPWKQKIWQVAGETLSLDDIEHKKLREELKEPRIHFAIVCASIGCPDLTSKAFTVGNVEALLTERAAFFFTQKKNFYLEQKNNIVTIHLSSILKWFADDFGKNQEERIAFVLKYTGDADKKKIEEAEKIKIKHIKYNWSLNKK